MRTYGQIAYEASAEVLAAATGFALPPWDDLDDVPVNAWMAAGRAVDVQVRTDGIDVPRELAAALAETRTVRDRYASLCREFGPSPQTGWFARISLTVLNRHRADAGLDRFTRTPSNDREDTMLRYRRERDEARAVVAEIAADWADLLTDDQRKRAGLEPLS